MTTLIVLFLFTLTVTSAFEDLLISKENSVYDYHNKIGIPLAQKLKRLETVNSKNVERIVGGSVTYVGFVPYQAGLLITVQENLTSVCGGSIISDTAVLTAAHCYSDGINTAQSITVVLGSNFLFSGGTRLPNNDVVVHPNFNPFTAANDIAVVRTAKISFTSLIKPIDLPILPSNSEANENFTGRFAIASGYGLTDDMKSISLLQTLHWVYLNVISNEECKTAYGEIVLDHHICTAGQGGVGTCRGDSGGPLITFNNGRRILIGITSYGSEECEASLPSAYTRVTHFRSWISLAIN